MNGHWLLLTNLAATWYLVGLIWVVQVVHYPLFDRVGAEGFRRYEADHSWRITPIVGIPMMIELATAVLLVVATASPLPRWASVGGLALIGLIWLSTAVLQVPCHQRLATGFDPAAYRWLVATNWIRTALWTARGGGLLYFAGRAMARI